MDAPQEIQRPAYGSGALSDLLPSVLSSLGVAGEPNALSLPPSQRTIVLLIDGLGWHALKRHSDAAPFLSSTASRPITVGFPTTTASSIASLGTGLPPGQHGLTGYTSYVPEVGSVVNWLGWQRAGANDDLRADFVPEHVQPHATCFERAVAAGVGVFQVAPTSFLGSGLTRAVLRGGSYVGTVTAGDVAATAVSALNGLVPSSAFGGDDRRIVYCYNGDLDLVGHVRGPDSDSWRAQLRLIDMFVEELASRLPSGTDLYVTADHGMASVRPDDRIDYDSNAALQQDVLALAGEGRARHVHVEPGSAGSVLERWRNELGDRFWVLSRDEAIAEGLFGAEVTSSARGRVGDVVAIARAGHAIVRLDRERRLSALLGQHGALTEDELYVPLAHTSR